MNPVNAASWDILFGYQKTKQIVVNLLEIGVYQGLSGKFLGAHCSQDERHLIDFTGTSAERRGFCGSPKRLP
jgi:hypothetical protein